MRIGLVIYGDINTVSGGYLYDRKLVEHLRENGDEVSVISLSQQSYFKALCSNAIPEVFTKTSANKFDVVIQDELVHPSFWTINNTLKKHLNCPVIALVHLLKSAEPAPRYMSFIYRAFEKRYLQSVDGLIVNSNETLDKARMLLNNTLPPVVTAVPCGNNFLIKSSEQAISRSYEDHKLKLLFVGNISRQKNLHVVIEAMSEINDDRIILTVIGKEDIDLRYLKKIKKIIKSRGLSERIHFKGQLGGEALKEQYCNHDVFVLPSVNEAYGIVFLEAMQFSLPVLGCSSGGAKEIIEDGENGFLIQPDDSFTLAEKIRILHEDKTLIQRMSNYSRQKYIQHPVWKQSIDKIRTFLLSMAHNQEARVG